MLICWVFASSLQSWNSFIRLHKEKINYLNRENNKTRGTAQIKLFVENNTKSLREERSSNFCPLLTKANILAAFVEPFVEVRCLTL